ncbi:PREDICTED: attractin-like protein 1 [Priapulus caudatus]|uniref:Attractin-like protein 1 n=1 Tax=Priapulus caudatus TaxID=37621 RepID=A0ABM1E6M5_PRICU|nr:PREDICTED: attractin-like protein 1 [Priapulus caudatus]
MSFTRKSHRSKVYGNRSLIVIYIVTFVVLLNTGSFVNAQNCDPASCVHGTCSADGVTCVCDQFWTGANCNDEQCHTRISLLSASEGVISDGEGEYLADTRCTWLLDTGSPGALLRFRLQSFETECGWDHLYIYDGDSIYSPLVAAYSGILVEESSTSSQKSTLYSYPEVTTRSGKAYLYFHSDSVYFMDGFEIAYSVLSCAHDCYGNGVCEAGSCTCSGGWSGEDCSQPPCNEDHCSVHGSCDVDTNTCVCLPGYQGSDCSIPTSEPLWSTVTPVQGNPISRASHSAVVVGDSMWVVGGYIFPSTEIYQHLMRFDFLTKEWKEIVAEGVKPSPVWGHSLVHYRDEEGDDDQLWLYGGYIGNTAIADLWMYSITNNTWSHMSTQGNTNQNLAVFGHTATVVGDIMVIIFGHHPIYGYINTVQEFNFKSREWRLVETSGGKPRGTYGHTSVFDERTGYIYVHGGIAATTGGDSQGFLVDQLLRYEPATEQWFVLHSSGSRRYLHASSLSAGLMLVYGGNTHNDSTQSTGAKCLSSDFMAYDTVCDQWLELSGPSLTGVQAARFGHSTATYGGNLYVFAGFAGTLLNDIMLFTPGNCLLYTGDSCTSARPGVICVLSQSSGTCMPLDGAADADVQTHCPELPVDPSDSCGTIFERNCLSCLETDYDCAFCLNYCNSPNCSTNPEIAITNSSMCPEMYSNDCSYHHNCHSCTLDAQVTGCSWTSSMQVPCIYEPFPGTQRCEQAPCSSYTDCNACITSPEGVPPYCMWCASEGTCMEPNAYLANYPYGQCLEWTNSESGCLDVLCSEQKTCEECHQRPGCGWCNDDADTGLGVCMDGGDTGPVNVTVSGDLPVPPGQCAGKWHFSSCPLCSCNGHSTCAVNSSVCLDCADHTEGMQCETCSAGFWGNALQGNMCQECDCNSHGTEECDRKSGTCTCTTKGIIGNQCETCDARNNYVGDAMNDTCYFPVMVGYIYTVRISTANEKYISSINYICAEQKENVDIGFSINCDASLMFNLTWNSDGIDEEQLLYSRNCTGRTIKVKLSRYELDMGRNNFTLYLYIYNFSSPITIAIMFLAERTALEIIQFLLIFFGCFTSLLVISALIWKAKDKWDLHRRRQRLFVEMEKMASRPFTSVFLMVDERVPLVEDDTDVELLPSIDLVPVYPMQGSPGKSKSDVDPVVLEPCSNNHYYVMSAIVRLPTGGGAYTPDSTPGVVIGSTLIDVGKTRPKDVPKAKAVTGSNSERIKTISETIL